MISYFECDNRTYIVGETDEIKAVAKALYRAWQKDGRTELMPAYVERPKFSTNKASYGLVIDEDGRWSVVSSDIMMLMILDLDKVVI